MLYVGTSGWQYDDWRGAFYPHDVARRRWLGHLATRFSTVEVNNSFYRLPSAVTFERWRGSVPPGFVLAVKASRFITHIRRLRECREPIELLWSRARALGDRLGPFLFQLPPRFPADPDRLRAFLSELPPDMRAAFEFRDPSWLTGEVARMLDDAGAALAWADRPGTRGTPPVTGGWLYARFHQGTRSAPGYRRDKLRRWAERIADAPARDGFVYFNNDADAAAPRDAMALIELLEAGGARVAEPPIR